MKLAVVFSWMLFECVRDAAMRLHHNKFESLTLGTLSHTRGIYAVTLCATQSWAEPNVALQHSRLRSLLNRSRRPATT